MPTIPHHILIWHQDIWHLDMTSHLLYSRLWEGNICCKLLKDWDGGCSIKYEVTEFGKLALADFLPSEDCLAHGFFPCFFSWCGLTALNPVSQSTPWRLYDSATDLHVRKKTGSKFLLCLCFLTVFIANLFPLSEVRMIISPPCLLNAWYSGFFLFFNLQIFILSAHIMCSSSFII